MTRYSQLKGVECPLTILNSLPILTKMGKLRLGNKEVEGEYVAFTPIREEWNEYKIGNYILKTKQVVSEVFQVKDQTDALGNPLFYMQASAVTVIKPIEE